MTKRALVRTIERLETAHAEERARLIATICALAGKPYAAPSPLVSPLPDQRPAEPIALYEE